MSLSRPLPLLLFLHITKYLTFMTDTTVAKRAEIFILMKTGIFERKNAIVAAFNETQSERIRSSFLCLSRALCSVLLQLFS